MPAKVVCPSCHMSLNAPDDLLGQAVKCEECGSTFTARAPARPRAESAEPARGPKTKYRTRDVEDDDDDRPRRRTSRRDDDDEDDRPRPRRAKKKGSGALPFVLAGGGLVLFVLVAAGVGLYFVFRAVPVPKVDDPAGRQAANNPGGFGPLPPAAPLPNNAPPVAGKQPAAGAEKVRLSNPRWGFGRMGGDFEVDYDLTGGRPAGGRYTLKWKYSDGNGGSADLLLGPFDGTRGTWKITVIGAMGRGRRGGMEIWVEEGVTPGPFGGNGTKVSNSVTLN